MDDAAASEIGSVLSAVLWISDSAVLGGGDDDALVDDDHYSLQRRRARALAAGGDDDDDAARSYAAAANLTDTMRALCKSLLATSEFAGAEARIAKQRFGLACYRESFDWLDGRAFDAPTASERVTFPSNVTAGARLVKRSTNWGLNDDAVDDTVAIDDDGTAGMSAYVDLVLATFDQDLYSAATADASNARMVAAVAALGDPALGAINGGVLASGLFSAPFDEVVVLDGLTDSTTGGALEVGRLRRRAYGSRLLQLEVN